MVIYSDRTQGEKNNNISLLTLHLEEIVVLCDGAPTNVIDYNPHINNTPYAITCGKKNCCLKSGVEATSESWGNLLLVGAPGRKKNDFGGEFNNTQQFHYI